MISVFVKPDTAAQGLIAVIASLGEGMVFGLSLSYRWHPRPRTLFFLLMLFFLVSWLRRCFVL